jgi:predicted nucleic acid-binding protein
MPTPLVVDSFALLAFLKQEPGYKEVAELLRQAADGQARVGITAVNLGEVWYRLARFHSEAEADRVVVDLMDLGVEVVEAGWALSRQAAAYKKAGGLSFADCCAAALAKAWGAPLVTGDPEFRRLEAEVRLQWLRRK